MFLCVSAVYSRVCVLCMCELCVCVGGTRGFRVVSKCCKGVDGLLCVVCISARVVAVWENALERPCVLVRVCGVHACANMGDCEVATENRRFHKTRISHLIGATAGTDGTCQLSASSISLSTRYDFTSAETHEVGVKFVDVATTEHVSQCSCVGHGKLFLTLDSGPTLMCLEID